MAYIIAEPCIGTKDTACVDACPVDCIHPKSDEDDFDTEEMLYIDPEECIDCGACVPGLPCFGDFCGRGSSRRVDRFHRAQRRLLRVVGFSGPAQWRDRAFETGALATAATRWITLSFSYGRRGKSCTRLTLP